MPELKDMALQLVEHLTSNHESILSPHDLIVRRHSSSELD